MKELKLTATVESLDEVLAFIDTELESVDCPMKIQMQLDVAVEELYVNIAHYAYAPGTGEATVSIDITQDPLNVTITFKDSGIPFDPDVTLSAQERQIGGLGIYMAKKGTDEMKYEYKDGQNILSISKKL